MYINLWNCVFCFKLFSYKTLIPLFIVFKLFFFCRYVWLYFCLKQLNPFRQIITMLALCAVHGIAYTINISGNSRWETCQWLLIPSVFPVILYENSPYMNIHTYPTLSRLLILISNVKLVTHWYDPSCEFSKFQLLWRHCTLF